jgi:hypothetical protein
MKLAGFAHGLDRDHRVDYSPISGCLEPPIFFREVQKAGPPFLLEGNAVSCRDTGKRSLLLRPDSQKLSQKKQSPACRRENLSFLRA